MTNKELIEALQALPPDAIVEMFQPGQDYWHSDREEEVGSVKFNERDQTILLR